MKNTKKTLLWLDDKRNPIDHVDFDEYSEVHWVQNYDEFVEWIEANDLPDVISFDHDLEESHYTPEEYWDDYEASKRYQEAQLHERTGYHAAKWLINHCQSLKVNTTMRCISHSANPVGRDKINLLLTEANMKLSCEINKRFTN